MNKKTISINNNRVSISCIIVNFNENEIPLIIIPGATNSADDIDKSLKDKLIRYHIIVSLRGRGKSSIPEKGYTLDEQASDILAVIKHLDIDAYYIFGYSVGVGLAIRAAWTNKHKVKGIIIGDYPPIYPSFDKSWVSKVKKCEPELSDIFLNGIAKDSKFTNLVPELKDIDCPVLLLKAGQKNSAFPTEVIPNFQKSIPNGRVDILTDRGHDIFAPNPNKLIERIEKFIKETQGKK